jgi:murein L,D-transpeptidase YafK
MRRARHPLSVFVLIGCIALSAISSADPPAKPPPITRVWIGKSAHELKLYAGDQVIKTYRVAIGPGGPGPKWREGDKVTPVGRYHITMHQPSQFSIFLRLDYPTQADWARFAELKRKGSLPENATIGGDIGIHGTGNPAWDGIHKATDWTLGCIALDNAEIAEVAGLVKDGTVVDIDD